MEAFGEKPRLRSLLDHFAVIEDPREAWRVAHPLPEVLLLVVCASIASCDDFDDIAAWGKTHLSFLRRFLPYHHGVPGARWLNILLNRIDPGLFSDCFMDYLGAGSCEFINAIHCGEKIAVDLNPDLEQFLESGKAVVAPSSSMPEIVTGSVDVVFTSNFFEHLPNKAELLATLDECHRIIHDDGRLLVVMPNIRYLPGRYWDYFDHHLALTHYSLVEALTISGFRPELVVPRFLPYTIKHTRLPNSVALVKLYMRVPFAWRFLGEQMFVIARRVPTDDV